MKTAKDLIEFITKNDLEDRPLGQIFTVFEYDREISHNQITNFEVDTENLEINLWIYDDLLRSEYDTEI